MKQSISAAIMTFAVLLASPALAHEKTARPATASYDVQFLDSMVEHHREGIEMFEIAAKTAKSGAVSSKAQQMLDEQTKEIGELKSLRDGIDPHSPKAVDTQLPGMMKMDLAPLKAAEGSAFDRVFLAMTIDHHRGALKMSNSAAKRAESEAVKERAKAIIVKQTKEIEELKTLQHDLKQRS